MKINILIMTWINRVLMTPFGFSLLIGLFNKELFYYSSLIAFAIGCFQVFSSLITSLYFLKLENHIRKLLIIYMTSVIIHFGSFYLFIEFESGFSVVDFLIIIFWVTPIILSIFWTYILESIKKEL